MSEVLDLCVTLTAPPADAPAGSIASLKLECDRFGTSYSGDLLADPLTPAEREDLRWYLEEYWQYPFDGFAERGRQVEALLGEMGRRLYDSVFGTAGAMKVVQPWRFQPGVQRQVSIAGDVPNALDLPWELLHDEQGFLALRAQPVSILRRLPQGEAAGLLTTFTPPLRILLVTARPEGAGFVDPRGIARELLDEVEGQVEQGTIVVEFLRPPTLRALRERLRDATRPVHVLHFDGHGAFERQAAYGPSAPGDADETGRGLLAFENEDGGEERVSAEDLAQVLQGSGVRLAVLTACRSATGAANDLFSSTATRLIRSGVDAVVAMSANVLVVTAARYVEAFYRALAGGMAAPVAHEQARQALHDDPTRHPFRRRRDEEGAPVRLRDWWLPHFYQQRTLALRPTAPPSAPLHQAPKLSDLPTTPRYGFSGRAHELHQIERWLLRRRLVVIRGFGGMGKTALAAEAASWLTRTGLYRGACFVSFEGGGGAPKLLSALGQHLGITSADFNPEDVPGVLTKVRPFLREQPTLLIADNLETVLPGGEAPLDPADRTELWNALLTLAGTPGCGVLATTRDATFGDARMAGSAQVSHLRLEGLDPDDAYVLATNLLDDLGVDRQRAPYRHLRDLLAQLDHHPLAIQLVLPALRELSPAAIRTQFAELLPRFTDDTATGRNRSLLASLEYSLQRLADAQRALLPRLALFEGGASEVDLLAITEIPEGEWATLRLALEQAALLVPERVHDQVLVPFMRFHPVLVPFLRAQPGADDGALRERFAQRYHELANYLDGQDNHHPQAARALARRELPNLRHALLILLELGDVDAASDLLDGMARFLTLLGMGREQDDLRQRLARAVNTREPAGNGGLTQAEYLGEAGKGKDEYERRNLPAAQTRSEALLGRILAQPAGAPRGPGSYEHTVTLVSVARCLRANGQPTLAEAQLRQALAVLDALLARWPDTQQLVRLHSNVLSDLGNSLHDQGKYDKARAVYEQALQVAEQLGDLRGQAVDHGQLGALALRERHYDMARTRYVAARNVFTKLGEPTNIAMAWHQLGHVALVEKDWGEAERCYRESLIIHEQLGDRVGIAGTCNQLAIVAQLSGRPSEAEGWYRRALGISGLPVPLQASLYNNLAGLLVGEVQGHHGPDTRLVEARTYAEQALKIRETLDLSEEPWTTLGILARIADFQERPEAAREYRHRERNSFAAFAGNRHHIDRSWGKVIALTSSAARGDREAQQVVEEVLPQLEANGWQIAAATRRIWAGERDWHSLTEDIDRGSALLVLRVLETLQQPAA